MERGPLRLKGSGGSLGAGEREKAKDEAQIPEQIPGSKEQEEEKRGLDKRTPAQVKVQEKQQMEQILNKVWETHEQREEESGRHWDALSEHCHIPKVSCTE